MQNEFPFSNGRTKWIFPAENFERDAITGDGELTSLFNPIFIAIVNKKFLSQI